MNLNGMSLAPVPIFIYNGKLWSTIETAIYSKNIYTQISGRGSMKSKAKHKKSSVQYQTY